MRDFSDNCVVLRIKDYRDDDRLADVFTAEHGLVTVVFRGVKKEKAKLKPFAQPFTVFSSRLTSSKGVYLTPIEPMLISDGFTLCSDLKLFTAASVAAEATVAALVDDEKHPELYIEFLKFLSAAEFNGDPYYQSAVYMLRLLELSGFYREYAFEQNPLSPQRMLGYAQRMGYEKREESDMSRRALKFISSEFQKNFDIGLKSVQSIDLY
ncbi:MAG: DNA repair protein RecO [Clostridiales bacterium]|nr:DNA repair protein RecO [Clostridiales bacterium]